MSVDKLLRHFTCTMTCARKVDEAVTNAVLRSGVRVLSGWRMIDWVLTRNADGQIAIESVAIEKARETRTLVCDVLLNFYEKTINLDAFLGGRLALVVAHDPVRALACFHELTLFSLLPGRSHFQRLADYRLGLSYERSVYFCRWYRDEILQEILRRVVATHVFQ